jgi:hypothetical protein
LEATYRGWWGDHSPEEQKERFRKPAAIRIRRKALHKGNCSDEIVRSRGDEDKELIDR